MKQSRLSYQPWLKRLILLGLGCQCLMASLIAQEKGRNDIDLDAFIQELFPIQDEDINYEDIYESLFQFYRLPLNLNRASREELQSLYLLSELQINNFLKYRNDNGKLLSIYELQAIPGMDLVTIQRIRPFVEAKIVDESPQPLLKRIFSEKNNYLLLRYSQVLEERKGFTDEATPSQTYLGSPGRLYARFRVSHPRDFSLGFTVEKDDGETFAWDPDTRRYGMDFFSFHAQFQNKGRFKNIALGDYQMQFGQGLLLSGGFGLGKGSETVLSIRRSNLGILPYTSVLESGYFRGGAFTYELGQFDLTGFYSNVRRDGTITDATDSTDAEFEAFIETLRTSGLHRTQTEIEGKGRFKEQSFGGNASFTNGRNNLQVGATFIHTRYNIPFQRNIDKTQSATFGAGSFAKKGKILPVVVKVQANIIIGLTIELKLIDHTVFGAVDIPLEGNVVTGMDKSSPHLKIVSPIGEGGISAKTL
ncbi:MAG: helix-hairpin-helix domain-containing protein, partial [Bacteroidota bacterium]